LIHTNGQARAYSQQLDTSSRLLGELRRGGETDLATLAQAVADAQIRVREVERLATAALRRT